MKTIEWASRHANKGILLMSRANLRFGIIIGLCTSFGAGSQSQNIRLEVETKQCIQGVLMHPIHANVSVFDTSKVPELLKMAQEFRKNSNPTDEQGPEKMLSIYSALQKKGRNHLCPSSH